MRIKRCIDIVIALLALAILWPIMLATALVVALGIGRPILFTQARPGRHGVIFKLYKFRSMTDARGPDGALLPDAIRLTTVGRWLRASSCDELPQLFNVLRGDISLVGPRPLLSKYLELYSPEQARRHDVRPGITGWAQVNGRNAIDWDRRLALDVWYVDNRSLRLDLLILWKTLWIVIRRSGVAEAGSVTMTEFGVASRHDVQTEPVDAPKNRS